uniref:Uncharacterized protein n=1 Tax=Meloidogyne javanica TaxID=6303 RepID=A0A915MIV3_MELJA
MACTAELADHEDRIQRLRSKNIGNTSDVANVKDIFGSSVLSNSFNFCLTASIIHNTPAVNTSSNTLAI